MKMQTINLSTISEFVAPVAPDGAELYLPENVESFGDGLWYVISQGIRYAAPDLSRVAAVCCTVIAVLILLSIFSNLSESTVNTVSLAGVATVCCLLLNSSNVLIEQGVETITQISDYGKMLIPILCTALAAQGGGTSAAALYAGTIVFNNILTTLLKNVLIPVIYIYIVICIANRALENEILDSIAKLIKDGISWILKTTLYLFTGYMTITGVVSGSVDAAAIKAAKITISSSVPVVGGILSDASEALLAGIGIAKSTAGVTGLLIILAIWIGPFLKIGIQYLLLKLTGSVCVVFSCKSVAKLVNDFSSAMGFLLAAIGSIGFIHLVSTVCFIKGVA